MLERAQTQTYAPASRRLLSPGPASNCSSLVTRHYFIQSLAKHNRKPSQIIENNRQRPKSIASFCRVLCAYSDGQPTFSRQPTLTRAPAAPPSQAAHRSILLLSKRQASQLEPSQPIENIRQRSARIAKKSKVRTGRMIIYRCVCCSWIPLLERSARDSIRDAKTALVNPFLAVIQ